MKNKEIKVGIDQFTLVLQPVDMNFSFDDWQNIVVNNIIEEFIFKSKLTELFDNFSVADVRLPEGYSNGYSFNNAPFYFCIAYHEAFWKMGIIVKFSAYAWEEYQKRYVEMYKQPIQIHSFFHLIESKVYSFRLSRIDPCVDFFNYEFKVDELQRSIEQGRTELRYGKY